MSQGKRQPPIIAPRSPEPEPGQDVAAFVAAIKQRNNGGGRKSTVPPSEKRRRARQMTLTFSDSSIPDRLRTLAKQWKMYTHNELVAVSELVELLLLPQLELAERGQIMLDDLQEEELPSPPPVGEQWL